MQILNIVYTNFKTVKINYNLQIYYMDNKNGTYIGYMSNQNFLYKSSILSESDIENFETNYKSSAIEIESEDDVIALSVIPPKYNQEGSQLVTASLSGIQGITDKPQWYTRKHTALANSTNFFDIEITDEIYLIAGEYYVWDTQYVDKSSYLEFSLIDKNDKLGYFQLLGLTVGVDIFEIHKFLKYKYLYNCPEHDFSANGISWLIIEGLYMRITVVNTTNNDIDLASELQYFQKP